MKYPTENDVKKIGPVVRAMAAFILLCSFIAGVGLGVAAVTEPFHLSMIVGVVVIGLMVHVSANVVFRGYAPKYLLFTHGSK
jgi:fatty acid desaturase